MADLRRPRNDITDLEHELSALSSRIGFPPTPNLTSAVRLAMSEQPVSTLHPQRSGSMRHLLVAAAIVVLALLGGLVLSDGFRTTVADVFGVSGVHISISRGDATLTPATVSTKQPSSPTIGENLLLGQLVPLDVAQEIAPFAIGVPHVLGSPDETYVRTLPDGNLMVSFLYRPRSDLPKIATTGAGALLMQFATTQPTAYLGEQIAEGYHLVFTEVLGKDAIWIEGAHDLILLSDPSRGCCDDARRTAGSVLLWEVGNQTFRFESDLPQAEAVAIAESITHISISPPPTQTGN